MVNAIVIGKIGEHICCTRLLKLGFSAEIVHLDTTDVVVKVNSTIIRVQVKASLKNNHKTSFQFNAGYTGKKHPLTKEHCDILAFVAIPFEKVYFLPVEQLNGQCTKRIKMSAFKKKDLEKKTWKNCLNYLIKSHEGSK